MLWDYDISKAPRNNTLLMLKVKGGEHPLEDSDDVHETVGFNAFEDTGEDEWNIVGWCWSHDHFVKNNGVIVAWMTIPK